MKDPKSFEQPSTSQQVTVVHVQNSDPHDDLYLVSRTNSENNSSTTESS